MDEHERGLVDARWRALSSAGNDAFRRGETREARALYELAIDEARRLFTLAKAGNNAAIAIAPVLHTIAHHNLAELERSAGNGPRSCELLERALVHIIDVARDTSLPLALRRKSFDTIKHALAELFEHSADPSGQTFAPVITRAMGAWLSLRGNRALEAFASSHSHQVS